MRLTHVLVLLASLAACQKGGEYHSTGVFIRDLPANPYGGLTPTKGGDYDLVICYPRTRGCPK